MLGILVRFDYIDDEPMFSNGSKHIDAAGLQRRPCLFRMAATLIEGTGLAEAAGSGSQAKTLVITRKKDFPLHLGGDLLRIQSSALE